MTDKFQWKRGSYQNPLYIFYQDESGAFSPENFQYSTGTVQRPAFVITLDGSGNQIFPVPEAPSDSVVYGRKNGAWVNIDTGDDTRYVNTAGDTMTGSLVITNGSAVVLGGGTAGAPSLILNGLTNSTAGFRAVGPSGWSYDRVGVSDFQYDSAHIYTRFAAAQGAVYPVPNSITSYYQDVSTAQTGFLFARLSAVAAAGPRSVMVHSRGTTWTDYTAVASGDMLGDYVFSGSDGTAIVHGGSIRGEVDGAVSTGVMPLGITMRFGTGFTEVFRFRNTGALQISSNDVIDSNRVFQNRVYTVATLPAGAAGKQSWASDLGGGAGLVVHDGTAFKRASNVGYAAVATDAAFTLTTLTSAGNIRHTGTLTADRIVTLSTTNAVAGAEFLITRTGTGAFNLNVGAGTPLKALTTNTWAKVVFDGTLWYLAAYGAL